MIGTLCATIMASTMATGFSPTEDLFAVHGPGSQFGFADQASCRISLCEDEFDNDPREVIDLSTDSCEVSGSSFGHSDALGVRTIFPDQPSNLLSALSAAPGNSFTLHNGGTGQLVFVLETANEHGASFRGMVDGVGMVLLTGADMAAVKRALRSLSGVPLPSVTGIVADADTVVVSDAVMAYALDVRTSTELGRASGNFAGAASDEISLAGVLCALREVQRGGVAPLLLGVYDAFPDLMRLDDDCEP
ncbi:MAG: hypothetical protein AAF675_00040 [Pseudomonadota bacterium]